MNILKIPIKNKLKGTQYMEIDTEDYDKIKHLNLTLNHTSNKHTFYCKSRVYVNSKYVKSIHIHREIMGLGDYVNDKRQIHHIDGNGLNNKKSNLEICNAIYNSQSKNQVNRPSKYYYFENDPKRKNKWRVMMTIFGKQTQKRLSTEQECIDYVKSI